MDKSLTMANPRGHLGTWPAPCSAKEAEIACAQASALHRALRRQLDLGTPTRAAPWIVGWRGMVNPNVLRAAGVDPEVLGLRVGMGIERTPSCSVTTSLTMHDMVEGVIRFPEQFGMEI